MIGIISNPSANAQEEKRPLFTLDPIHGDLGLVYNDYGLQARTTGTSSSTKVGYFSQELNLRDRLTILDPRFLELDLGLGLRLSQGRYDADGDDTKATRYFLNGRFLKRHPYPLNIYLRKFDSERVNSATSVSLVEQKNQGFNLELQEKLGLPFPITIQFDKLEEGNRSTTIPVNSQSATGQTYRFDQTISTSEISSRKKWKTVDLWWKLNRRDVDRRQDSFGILNLTQYRRDEFFTTLTGQEGEKDRFQWSLYLDNKSQSDFPNTESSQARASAAYKLVDVHATTLSTSLRLSTNKTENQTLNTATSQTETRVTKSNSAEAGLQHRLYQSLFTNLTMSSQETTSTDSTLTDTRTTLGTQYLKNIPHGKINMGVSVTETAAVNTGQRKIVNIDEPHDITTALPVTITLNSQNVVVVGAPATPNDPTQRPRLTVNGVDLIENTDYVLNPSGTSLQIIIGSGANPGDTVLIDYSYQIPVSDVGISARNFTFGVRWRFAETYYRQSAREVEIFQGGQEERLLHNPGTNTVYGFKLRQKVDRVTPELNFEWEQAGLFGLMGVVAFCAFTVLHRRVHVFRAAEIRLFMAAETGCRHRFAEQIFLGRGVGIVAFDALALLHREVNRLRLNEIFLFVATEAGFEQRFFEQRGLLGFMGIVAFNARAVFHRRMHGFTLKIFRLVAAETQRRNLLLQGPSLVDIVAFRTSILLVRGMLDKKRLGRRGFRPVFCG